MRRIALGLLLALSLLALPGCPFFTRDESDDLPSEEPSEEPETEPEAAAEPEEGAAP